MGWEGNYGRLLWKRRAQRARKRNVLGHSRSNLEVTGGGYFVCGACGSCGKKEWGRCAPPLFPH